MLKLILSWCPHKGKKILKFTDKLAEELYKPVTRKFRRRRVNVNGIDDILAADLIDIQAFSKDKNGIKYLLTVFAIFSKFVWIVLLERKTGQEVAKVFSIILKERRPSKMWVDKGREFYIKDVQKLVELYSTGIEKSTYKEEKSCVIERFNITIKEKMFKYFSVNSTRKFEPKCTAKILFCRAFEYAQSIIVLSETAMLNILQLIKMKS